MSEIRKQDIAEENVLNNLIPTTTQIELIEKMNTALKEAARLAKEDLGSGSTTNVSEIKKQQKAQQDLNKVTKQKSTLDKELLKLNNQKEKLLAKESTEYKKLEKSLNNLKDAQKKKAKADRDEQKQIQRNTNAYTKLSDASRRYKNESKTLGAELLALEQAGKKNSKVWNETQKRYTQVTAKARTTDAQLKKLDKTVGDNFRNVGNYRDATQKLTGALASLGIAVGIGQIFRNVGGIIADFNQAQTDLQAISGKSADELAPLTKQAKELGETTQFSATQVTGLQIELAKLGFTTQEIMDSTGGIANFAAATGVEIPRAAALAGSALRAFGLDASEMDRVVSTLGVATTKTALDFSKLENGLSTVAPVAKSFGFSIEDTTALLGQLANSGFDASSSATATRNILLNLADANGKLAKQLGRPIKSADDLADGLKELQEQGVDLGEALELTDKRSVAAFQTFLDGSDSLVDLRDSITDVNGELKDMADKRIESVGGAMALLNSAWEGFILNLNEGIGASDAFQTSIKFVAENLGTIITTLAKLVAGFLAYKATLVAVNIIQAVTQKGVKGLVKEFFNLGKNAKTATGETSKMGKALKGIGWAALIAVVIELAVAFYDAASGQARLRFESEEYAKSKERIDKRVNSQMDRSNKLLDENLDKTRKLKELGDLTEEGAIKRGQLAVAAARDRIKEEQMLLEAKIKRTKEIQKQAKEQKESAEQFAFDMEGNIDLLKELPLINKLVPEDNAFDVFTKATQEIKALEEAEARLWDEQRRLNGVMDEFGHQLKVVNKENNRDKINARVKGLKDQKEANDRLNKSLEHSLRIRELINELEGVEVGGAIGDAERTSKESLQAEIDLIEEGNFSILMSYTKRIEALKDVVDAETSLRKLNAENSFEFDKTTLEGERERLEAKENLSQKDKERIREVNLEIEILELQHQQEMAEITRQGEEKKLEFQEQIDDKLLEKQEKQNDAEVKAEEDKNKTMLELAREMQEQITDVIEQNIDKRIALLDKEADAARKQQDFLKGLAAEGNIEAQQSIKEEIENENEALKEQRRLEQQKRALQLVSSGLSTFNQQIEQGSSPGEALATTVATSKALVDFLSQLSFFAEGTENAPQGKAVVDEEGAEIIADKYGKIKEIGSDKGARIVDLSRGDKVITAPETSALLSQMGAVDNFAQQKIDRVGNSYDLMMLDKLGNIEKAIKSQPQQHTGYDKALGEVVSEIKGNGQRRINRYRTR